MKRFLLVLTLIIILPVSLSAREAPKNKRAILKQMDTDGDREISKSEFVDFFVEKKAVKQAEKQFGKLDADSDEMISKDEFLTFAKEKAKKQAEKRFEKMDTDSNGIMTTEEFKKMRMKSQ
ncbi:MAG: hypothetical protein V3U15_00890 [Nitrospinota bacterium]